MNNNKTNNICSKIHVFYEYPTRNISCSAPLTIFQCFLGRNSIWIYKMSLYIHVDPKFFIITFPGVHFCNLDLYDFSRTFQQLFWRKPKHSLLTHSLSSKNLESFMSSLLWGSTKNYKQNIGNRYYLLEEILYIASLCLILWTGGAFLYLLIRPFPFLLKVYQ